MLKLKSKFKAIMCIIRGRNIPNNIVKELNITDISDTINMINSISKLNSIKEVHFPISTGEIIPISINIPISFDDIDCYRKISYSYIERNAIDKIMEEIIPYIKFNKVAKNNGIDFIYTLYVVKKNK